MSIITINNEGTEISSIDGISSVSFDFVNKKITALDTKYKLIAVFKSNQIIADDGFLRWNEANWVGTQNNYNLSFFIRSSNASLVNEKWNGPYYNNNIDLSQYNGKYFQFMCVMITDGVTLPKLDSINLTYITSNTSVKFYTKTFNLGFKPETILLTYNANLTNDSVVKFFVCGDDSIDIDDYQEITPNTIESLTKISKYADKIKIMMQLSGSFDTDITISEFAVNIGGDLATRVNKS